MKTRPGLRASKDEAEMLAISALGFLAGDTGRLGRFLALTGLGPDDLRRAAGEPAVLGAVLGHLMGDERLLLAFAEEAGHPPESIATAHAQLTGEVGEW